MSFAAWLCLFGLASPTSTSAAPTAPQDEAAATRFAPQRGDQAGEGDDPEGELEHLNELALALAGTYEDEEGFFTVGLEYQRRIVEPLGVAGVVEYVSGKGSWVFVVPVVWHPYKGLELLAGPGFEREDGENDGLVRVGAAYSVEIRERYAITPFVEVDFIGRDEAVVFGSTFGISF